MMVPSGESSASWTVPSTTAIEVRNIITKQHPRTKNCRSVVNVFGEPKKSYFCRIHFEYSVVRLHVQADSAALRNAGPSTMRYLLAVK